jgi:uncharacterized paraquat-inducible protein A
MFSLAFQSVTLYRSCVLNIESNQETAAQSKARQSQVARYLAKHPLNAAERFEAFAESSVPAPGESVVPQNNNQCSATSNVVPQTDELCDRCKAILRKRKREDVARFRAKLKRYKKELDAD